MASIDENKELIQREIDMVWNEGNLDELDQLYAEEVSVATRRAGVDAPLGDRDDIRELYREWQTAFPDAEMQVNEMAAEDDLVISWWTIQGTHDGAFRDIEPTGNAVEVDGFSVRRIRDGRIVEAYDTGAMYDLLSQLGVEVPVPA